MSEHEDSKLLSVIKSGSFLLITYTMEGDTHLFSIQTDTDIDQPHTLTTFSEFGVAHKSMSDFYAEDQYKFLVSEFGAEMIECEKRYGNPFSFSQQILNSQSNAKSYHNLAVSQSVTLQRIEYTKPLSLRQTVYAYARRKGIGMKVVINADETATITRIQ